MAEPDELELVALSEVFPGVQIARLTETLFIFSKVRFEDGTTGWHWQSPGAGITNQEELLGALMMQVEVLETQLLESWE